MSDKTELRTKEVCIGTAGATVDGREIKEEWLTEAAESYDPKVYTANINYNHWKWAGNYGKVVSLAARKVEGVMKLFAVLSPNSYLIGMNKAGQAKFTSMEILENFANKGKAYLRGLAVTDNPASLGTTELNFSADSGQSFITDAHAFSMEMDEAEDPSETKLFAMIKGLLGGTNNTDNKTEQSNAMDDKQFNQLMDGINSMAKGFTALSNQLDKDEKPGEEGKSPAEEGTDDQTKDDGKYNDLQAKVDKLTKLMEENIKEQPGTEFNLDELGDDQKAAIY